MVTNLVASETARGSLEEEVAKSVATGVAAGAAPTQAPAAPPARGTAEGRHAPGAQLPGRGGRDAAAEPTRATPARTPRPADSQEELPGRSTTAADAPPAKPAPRSTSTGGGADKHAVLNATPEGKLLYRACGFRQIGEGITWWHHLGARIGER